MFFLRRWALLGLLLGVIAATLGGLSEKVVAVGVLLGLFAGLVLGLLTARRVAAAPARPGDAFLGTMPVVIGVLSAATGWGMLGCAIGVVARSAQVLGLGTALGLLVGSLVGLAPHLPDLLGDGAGSGD